ncbi:MAG: alcohol dehydrogenase catalytic domain-containing protein [Bryobacteraceae bacterium]
MRQIVLEAPRQFVGHVVPPVVRQPDQALVRLHRVAICGSDWHAFEGGQANYTYPRIIGHEMSCEVLELPGNPRGIRPGDRCASSRLTAWLESIRAPLPPDACSCAGVQ